MSRISLTKEQELEELRGFLEFYFTQVLKVDPADSQHPASFGDEAISKHGKSTALKGLRQAVNDIAGDLSDEAPEYITALDASLHKAGQITFSEVRRRFSSSYRKIRKRGQIANETEYYLASGILADAATSASNEEISSLEEMIEVYENSQRR